EAGFRMFGYTLSELQGQNINMLMPSPFCEEHDGYIRRYLATGERRIIGRSREAMALRRDGSTFPVELSVAEIDGERQFTGFIRDISERKELQRHVLEAAETEQQRIGSELHDGVQQELTALALFAGLMHRLVEGMSPSPDDREQAADQDRGQFPAALQQLTDITERLIRGLQETYQHVRDLAHGILPVVIDTEGLRAALEKLSSTMSASSGVPCSFVWSGDIAVHDNSVASHVYRIAQEAIGNAIHHGEPSRVELSLSGEKDHLVLEVADDGNGGGVLRSTASTGKGLRTMEYRASLIGGAIRIGRSRLGGTLVQCLIPRGVSAGESGSFQRDPDKPKTSGRAGYEAD
ncbi:MAG: PAS domain-containing sensor histidine kinase, partial [Planctomycetota bacterium]